MYGSTLLTQIVYASAIPLAYPRKGNGLPGTLFRGNRSRGGLIWDREMSTAYGQPSAIVAEGFRFPDWTFGRRLDPAAAAGRSEATGSGFPSSPVFGRLSGGD